MGGKDRKYNSGIVESVSPSDINGNPWGYIRDHDHHVRRRVFFENPHGIFKVGDEVNYTLRPGYPSPFAKGIVLKADIDMLVDTLPGGRPRRYYR